MLTLHDLQDRFATAVISGDVSPVAGSIIDDAPGAAARFGIYANHLCVTLIDALAATFPVVRQLVGDPFFPGGCAPVCASGAAEASLPVRIR